MLNNFNRELELRDGLETQTVKILYYEFDSFFKDDYKSYEYNRMCTILDGEKRISVNGRKQFSYDQNQYILLPANSSISMEIEKPTKALVLEISNTLLEKTSKKISSKIDFSLENIKNDFFLGCNEGNIDYCLKRIVFALKNTKEKDIKFLLDLYIQEMVYFLLKEKGAASILNKKMNHPISIAIEQMKNSLLPAISLEEISRNINMSLPTFSRKFKNIVGLSPKAYYTHLKLLEAKEILCTRSVNETAWALGFENISHFIRLFKTKYGCTPKEFQGKHT